MKYKLTELYIELNKDYLIMDEIISLVESFGFKCLGIGSTRICIKLNETSVAKLAKNSSYAVAANRSEVERWNKLSEDEKNYFAEVFAYHPEFIWSIMEYCDPVNGDNGYVNNKRGEEVPREIRQLISDQQSFNYGKRKNTDEWVVIDYAL